MASYAALLSLIHAIHQIMYHPRPPISLDPKQVDSIMESVNLLQDFLERYPSSGSKEDDDLESRIAGAAYAAEDVIETHIVHQIHAGSTSHGENIHSIDLHQGLEGVIGDMDSIKKEAMEIIKEKIKGAQHHLLHRKFSVATASVGSASSGQDSTMVGFDYVLMNEVLDKLTGQQHGLQIIPIVGMGGIGKTTLARNIYVNPLIVQRFDIRAWVTISREYSRRNILQALFQETKGSKNDLSKMSEDELGVKLYKHLCGKRYMIVMDDIWSTEAWFRVKSFFPNNNNESRIMITTRLSNLAFQISGSHDFQMKFLDENKSWNLLCEIVFGKDLVCPIELENIGKEIAKNCRGLPLSIVVIGGVLRKSKMTKQYWEYTLANVTSLVNLENNAHCLQILNTSYKDLPIYLKPCFLYMGIFPEDDYIHVSRVVKLWAAEGFLKPIDGKSLEEVAEEYVKELIDRNLILVHELRWNGDAKLCKIHDLLRDLCLREAQKQKFLCVLRQQTLNIPQGIRMERRICVVESTEVLYSPEFLRAAESSWLTRSLHYRRRIFVRFVDRIMVNSFSPCSGLLRVYSVVGKYNSVVTHSENSIFQEANLRYLSLGFNFNALSEFSSLCSLLWNIQMLKVVIPFSWEPIIAPSEIWKMPLLRHAILNGYVLPDPRPYREDDFVLENLQTLSRIRDFKCNEEVVKRIPNIKTLKFYQLLEEIA